MKNLKRLLVIDVEATCWQRPQDTPPGETSEIIQIGACLVDAEQLVRIDKRRIYVKPQRSRVSAFCTKLTGIREQDLISAPSLEEACQQLITDFRSAENVWASYGDYDRCQFEKQLGHKTPFGTRHINIKTLVGFALNLPTEIGMDAALERLGLPLEGKHHDAGDDAWNIAKIFIHLMQRCRNTQQESNK